MSSGKVKMIKRNPPLPDQIKLEMLSQIHAGTFADASGRLPSEDTLAAKYNVSRATIREALAQLSMAGIIIRRHGKGNFLRVSSSSNTRPFWSWLDLSPSFMDLIKLVGYEPKCVLLKHEVCPAGQFAPIFEMSANTSMFVFERVFYANEMPFIHSYTTIPNELIEGGEGVLSNPEDTIWESVYRILEELGHQVVNHQICEIRAIKADEKLSSAFEEYFGEPFLRLEEVGYNEEDRPLFHAVNHFHGNLVSFRLQRNPNVHVLQPNM